MLVEVEFRKINLGEQPLQRSGRGDKPVVPAGVNRIKSVRHVLGADNLDHGAISIRNRVLDRRVAEQHVRSSV